MPTNPGRTFPDRLLGASCRVRDRRHVVAQGQYLGYPRSFFFDGADPLPTLRDDTCLSRMTLSAGTLAGRSVLGRKKVKLLRAMPVEGTKSGPAKHSAGGLRGQGCRLPRGAGNRPGGSEPHYPFFEAIPYMSAEQFARTCLRMGRGFPCPSSRPECWRACLRSIWFGASINPQ